MAGLRKNQIPLVAFTIVKNGMPFISMHYNEFKALQRRWEWHVIEGTSAPEKCTQWCASIEPGLSSDGTTEYLEAISAFDTRVRHYKNAWWHGKVEMCNRPLRHIWEPCILLQIDSDELWTTKQLEGVASMLEDKPGHNATFWCNYFIAPNIVTMYRGMYGNRESIEWIRAWHYEPGMRWESHEPPQITGKWKTVMHGETEKRGLVFNHYSYVTEQQLLFKQKFYKYKNALSDWRKLKQNRKWPAKVKDFLPWVDDGQMCEPLKR